MMRRKHGPRYYNIDQKQMIQNCQTTLKNS